jgi:DNA-binding GntR family transcriptional regulator
MKKSQLVLSATQRAYTELKQRILDGVIAEGAPIRQDEAAEEIGISKIPVREALMRLQSEGLVVITRNAGATVAKFTVADYQEMLDIRIGLECRALELAIPNMVASDIEHARKLLVAYHQAMSAREWSELNRKFHECLYIPANNPRLLAMIDSLQNNMGRLLSLHVSMAANPSRSHEEHLQLVDACAQGNTELAVAILRKHIEQSKKEVSASFRSAARNIA